MRPPHAKQISAEEAQRTLKDMVFAKWLAQGCEERTDTLKMVRCAALCCAVQRCAALGVGLACAVGWAGRAG